MSVTVAVAVAAIKRHLDGLELWASMRRVDDANTEKALDLFAAIGDLEKHQQVIDLSRAIDRDFIALANAVNEKQLVNDLRALEAEFYLLGSSVTAPLITVGDPGLYSMVIDVVSRASAQDDIRGMIMCKRERLHELLGGKPFGPKYLRHK